MKLIKVDLAKWHDSADLFRNQILAYTAPLFTVIVMFKKMGPVLHFPICPLFFVSLDAGRRETLKCCIIRISGRATVELGTACYNMQLVRKWFTEFFLHGETILKTLDLKFSEMRSTFKGKNLLLQEQILSIKS